MRRSGCLEIWCLHGVSTPAEPCECITHLGCQHLIGPCRALGQCERCVTTVWSLRFAESKAYHKKAKDMYWNALVRKYVPFIVLGSVVILVLLIRWKFYT